MVELLKAKEKIIFAASGNNREDCHFLSEMQSLLGICVDVERYLHKSITFWPLDSILVRFSSINFHK